MVPKTKVKYLANLFIPLAIGGLFFWFLNCVFDLITIFGEPNVYVYYYAFSTIVQGFGAFIAFMGTLVIFKLQLDEDGKARLDPISESYNDDFNKLEESRRLMTFDLKRFVIIGLFNIAIALIAIPFIPYFNVNLLGPIYLGSNIVLSLWVLIISYPIIENVLRLTPQKK